MPSTHRCNLIATDVKHKTPCSISKLTAAFVSERAVFPQFSWSLDFSAKMAEFLLLVSPNWTISKTSRYSNPVDEYSIFMCQNVNIIVHIWSPKLTMCAITKIGGCTRLTAALENWQQLQCFKLKFSLSGPEMLRKFPSLYRARH